MADVSAETRCYQHPEELATATCDHCGKPLCSRCEVEEVAAEEVFCSESCRQEHSAVRISPLKLTDVEIIQNAYSPIRTGWRVWARSIPALSAHIAPLAIFMGLIALPADPAPDQEITVAADAAAIALVLAFLFGLALTQTVVSREYTGIVKGNLYTWTLRRFIPWLMTEAMYLAVTFLGLFALILPGIFFGLRLFWADELALVHEVGPVQALKESWQITRGKAGDIFSFQFILGFAANLVIFPLAFAMGLLLAIVEGVGNPTLIGPFESALLYLVIFVGYGGIHGPEVVYFYGIQADPSLNVDR